jgi:hypothetical protein
MLMLLFLPSFWNAAAGCFVVVLGGSQIQTIEACGGGEF